MFSRYFLFLCKKKQSLLDIVSILYVFIPLFLFILGWLKYLIALPLVTVLSIAIFKFFQSLPDDSVAQPGCINRRARALTAARYSILVLIVLVVTFYSGLGGFGWQNEDFSKHNGVLRDLIELSWPVAYHIPNQPDVKPFVTYIAFYLPAGMIGKIWGWKAANIFEMAWYAVGVYLTILWFLRLAGRISLRYTLIFLGFGGMDIIAWYLFGVDKIVKTHYPPNGTGYNWGYYMSRAVPELNSVFWYYGSIMAYFYWSFHHALPGFMIIFMIVYYAIHQKSFENIGFLYSALPLGSAFVALGMAPFVLVSLVTTKARRLNSFQNMVVAPLLLLVFGLFILSNKGNFIRGWLWDFQNLTLTWRVLLIFYVLSFGAYYCVCPVRLTNPVGRPSAIWTRMAIFLLLIIPFYRIGQYCDSFSKISLPAFLILLVYFIRSIQNAQTDTERNMTHLLLLLLIIGSMGSIDILTYQMRTPIHKAINYNKPIKSVSMLTGSDQLMGDPHAPFWKYLAKPIK